MPVKALVPVIALLAGIAAGARAASPGGPVETVEVRASAPPGDQEEAFATRLDVDEARERSVDLADLLRRVPGALIRAYGGPWQFATVSFRGSTGEQVTVLLDGIPRNRALGGPVDLSAIPATDVAEITAWRGFPPASAGLAGMGGLLDVRTRFPARPGGRFDLVLGSLGSRRVSGAATGRLSSRWFVRAGFEHRRTDGDFEYLDTGGTLLTTADDRLRRRENDDVRARDLFVHAVGRSVLGGTLALEVRRGDRDRGIPGPEGTRALHARFGEQDWFAAASWVRSLGGGGRLDLLLDGFARRQHVRDLLGELPRPATDQVTRFRGGGLAAIARGTAGRFHHWLVRGDARRERARVRDDLLAVSDRGGGRRRVVSLVVEDTFRRGRWVVSPAARWEARRDEFLPGGGGSLPPPAPDVRDHRRTSRLSVGWDAGGGFRLRASAGRFHHAPGLVELFGDRGSVVGNPRLRPERGRQVEAGVSWRRPPGPSDGPALLRGELVAFENRSRDLVLLVPNSQGTVLARNVGAARIRGVEASLEALLGGGVFLAASGTWQVPEDRSGGFADGKDLPGRPRTTGWFRLARERGPWTVTWEVTYVGPNWADQLNTPLRRVPSRTWHDVRVARRLGNGLSAGLEVRNLFDRRTMDVYRFPLPGRMVFVHVGWEWRR